MKYNVHISAFTLIELIVAITIFAMIMTSVMSIFLFSSQMSTRVELSRSMQENVKNVVEDIAEWIRKHGIEWVRSYSEACAMVGGTITLEKTWLCLKNGNEYIIWKETTPGTWLPVDNLSSECGGVEGNCRIIKRDSPGDTFYPMTNNFVSIKNLTFLLANEKKPRVTMNIELTPAAKKWLAPEIIENNTFHVQTTLSERVIQTK